MNKRYFAVIIFFAAGIFACSKSIPEMFHSFEQPLNFPAPAYKFAGNDITKEGFELGRKLFYETMLSANNTISCGSCHIQTSAFTHHGHSVSHGINDLMGTRNSPPVMNLAWSTSFMWDGGIADLDLQAIAPITNHVEMGETMVNVIGKLQSSSGYPGLFKKAFGSEQITTGNFLKALSQFMLMCVSSNSRYDSVMRSDAGKSFSAAEQQGYVLFKQKCASCHQEPLFTDQSFRNNGLVPSSVNDAGRYMITELESDRYKFKVPSLRNLSFTAPYMHDGRFLTLDAVLDHYNSQVQHTPNLDPFFTQNGTTGIPISLAEKQQLLTFLKTLDDKSFLYDTRFSEQ